MTIDTSYLAGKPVYQGGTPQPTTGTVDPTGYVTRALNNPTTSDSRSGLASAMLSRLQSFSQPQQAPASTAPAGVVAPVRNAAGQYFNVPATGFLANEPTTPLPGRLPSPITPLPGRLPSPVTPLPTRYPGSSPTSVMLPGGGNGLNPPLTAPTTPPIGTFPATGTIGTAPTAPNFPTGPGGLTGSNPIAPTFPGHGNFPGTPPDAPQPPQSPLPIHGFPNPTPTAGGGWIPPGGIPGHGNFPGTPPDAPHPPPVLHPPPPDHTQDPTPYTGQPVGVTVIWPDGHTDIEYYTPKTMGEYYGLAANQFKYNVTADMSSLMQSPQIQQELDALKSSELTNRNAMTQALENRLSQITQGEAQTQEQVPQELASNRANFGGRGMLFSTGFANSEQNMLDAVARRMANFEQQGNDAKVGNSTELQKFLDSISQKRVGLEGDQAQYDAKQLQDANIKQAIEKQLGLIEGKGIKPGSLQPKPPAAKPPKPPKPPSTGKGTGKGGHSGSGHGGHGGHGGHNGSGHGSHGKPPAKGTTHSGGHHGGHKNPVHKGGK